MATVHRTSGRGRRILGILLSAAFADRPKEGASTDCRGPVYCSGLQDGCRNVCSQLPSVGNVSVGPYQTESSPGPQMIVSRVASPEAKM